MKKKNTEYSLPEAPIESSKELSGQIRQRLLVSLRSTARLPLRPLPRTVGICLEVRLCKFA